MSQPEKSTAGNDGRRATDDMDDEAVQIEAEGRGVDALVWLKEDIGHEEEREEEAPLAGDVLVGKAAVAQVGTYDEKRP